MVSGLAITEPVEVQPVSPMHLLQLAVQSGAQIDTIERLAALQTQMRSEDAERSFNRAMHAAQGEMRRIGADATNTQTRTRYLTFAKLDASLRPIYTAHGFSVSFDSDPATTPDMVNMMAYVSHTDGFTRTYRLSMPADGKGAKGNDVMTRTHATGAAASYGARYLLKMIFNVAVGETDDDGNSASAGRERVGEGQMADYLDAIQACTNTDELRSVFQKGFRLAQSLQDTAAMDELKAAKDRRKEKLQ